MYLFLQNIRQPDSSPLLFLVVLLALLRYSPPWLPINDPDDVWYGTGDRAIG